MPDTAPQQAKSEAKTNWPYTPFRSLLNLLERLEAEKAIPPQIDRGILGGSEGQKTQLSSALKFFDLIGDNGTVNDAFRRLVENPKERPRLIKELLAKHYPAATALAAVNGTPKQLEETFVGMSGDTQRKAITFYLQAAKYSHHPTSKFFKVPSGFNGRRRGRGSTPTPASTDTITPPPPPPASDPKTKYIEMLMEKAANSDTLDTALLDRIEKLLGYPTSGEANA